MQLNIYKEFIANKMEEDFNKDPNLEWSVAPDDAKNS